MRRRSTIETRLRFTADVILAALSPLVRAQRRTELTIDGNRAKVRVVKDGLSGATGVTLVRDTALVLVERAKAVVVPYRTQ